MTDTALLESGVRDGLGAVKDVDEGKRQVLVTIPWEVIDSYNTDFARDCFDDFLGQRMPAMCWCHDKKEPIGAVKNWQKGERANEFVAEFSDFDAVPRSRQAFSQIKDGHLTDFSFYYDQAKAAPHPQTRGALRFSKARMPEISPVVVGSIPGAIVTGVREAADAAGVAELVRTKVITPEEGRAMLGIAGDVPELTAERERITVGGRRSIVVTIGDDGSITSASPDGAPVSPAAQPADDDPDEVQTLAGAVDAALDQAADLFAGVDETSLPEPVQQAMALVAAAGVTADALLDAMGIPDPDDDQAPDDGGRSADTEPADEPTTGERAAVSDKPWSQFSQADYSDAQWKAACLIVRGDAKADCSLPIKEPDGTLNRNAVHAAAARLGQVQASSEEKSAAAKALVSAYSTLGEDPPKSLTGTADGKRSADEEIDLDALEAEAEAAMALLVQRAFA